MTSAEILDLRRRYERMRERGFQLDLSRGRPSKEQLDLSLPMLEPLSDYVCEDGQDARNYGDAAGIPEARRLFGEILGMPPGQVVVGGNSSVHLIFDALSRFVLHGPLEGDTPWGKLPKVRFICPVPGYDWHFGMLDTLGIECVPVEIGEDGPDMEEVERLALDPTVKGMICVPMYSNPTGVTFSDAVVDRLARMETAAGDFRLIWDNAYCVHHLYAGKRERLKNIYRACVEAGNPDRPMLFTSTSKITFAGGGVSAMAASPRNMERQRALLTYQCICYDKINQLRHARFLPDLAAVEKHMERQAALLRPKFEAVEAALRELGDLVRWRKPLGGYFLCVRVAEGTARRVVELCRGAGVTLTPAGSTYPGGKDPRDSVLRLAPTSPPLEELYRVMEVFSLAVRLAWAEKAEGR